MKYIVVTWDDNYRNFKLITVWTDEPASIESICQQSNIYRGNALVLDENSGRELVRRLIEELNAKPPSKFVIKREGNEGD